MTQAEAIAFAAEMNTRYPDAPFGPFTATRQVIGRKPAAESDPSWGLSGEPIWAWAIALWNDYSPIFVESEVAYRKWQNLPI